MRPESKQPFLIVGAGLAGSMLAWHLERAGAAVRLIGSQAMPAAYRVAAGVINPVTGRWMTKSWNFDTLLPIARETYSEIEAALGIKAYHPIPEIRFCQNADDVKRAGRRLRNPRYANVLGRYLTAGQASPLFQDAHGSFEIESAAYVDLPGLIDALHRHLRHKGIYQEGPFRYDALRQTERGWDYQGMGCARVIFCEGAAVRSNPWFDWVGLTPAKGETLLCQSPGLALPQTLYHHRKWLLPYPDGRFRVGATFDESDLTDAPTEASRNVLLEDIRCAFREPRRIEVLHHLAGIRPGTQDSRPMIGPHPEAPAIYLLNGLGSKGATSGPAMVRQLAAHLLTESPIDPEVHVQRFYGASP